jgi:hypothetical protein
LVGDSPRITGMLLLRWIAVGSFVCLNCLPFSTGAQAESNAQIEDEDEVEVINVDMAVDDNNDDTADIDTESTVDEDTSSTGFALNGDV